MQDKTQRWFSFEWLKVQSNRLLTVIALFNLIGLFLTTSLNRLPNFSDFNIIYTQITLYLLISHVICGILADKISIVSIRLHIPDFIIILFGLAMTDHPSIFQLLIVVRQGIIYIYRSYRKFSSIERFKNLSDNAAIFVLLSFLITILIGTVLLLMPMSTAEGNSTNLIGALFTSTSATCVTGLIVYDTGTHFSLFGQLIILFLIQIGGLGIMTISTSFAILTGQRLSFRGESIMQNVINEQTRFDMMSLIKNIVIATLVFELIGAIFLYTRFAGDYESTSQAIFSSVFHSISAFCNAGFSLNANSMMAYRSHIGINITMILLIVFGGLGFSVLVDLKRNLLEKRSLVRFTLHTKIVLVTTVILLLLGFVLYFISEFNHSMENFTLKERILGSLFQSATTRTAGFNTIDNAHISKASVFISLILMFIGASPGSTGGGIKTTSFAVIILSIVAILSTNRDVIVFKRRLSDILIRRVMALIAISIMLIFIIIFLLMLIEPFSFEHIVFEVFSAFGTVGLSMGITPYLSETGRILITILMYFGRIGPLTFIFALSRKKMQSDYQFLEEKISVG